MNSSRISGVNMLRCQIGTVPFYYLYPSRTSDRDLDLRSYLLPNFSNHFLDLFSHLLLLLLLLLL